VRWSTPTTGSPVSLRERGPAGLRPFSRSGSQIDASGGDCQPRAGSRSCPADVVHRCGVAGSGDRPAHPANVPRYLRAKPVLSPATSMGPSVASICGDTVVLGQHEVVPVLAIDGAASWGE